MATKVLHYYEPCTGNLLLDISTKEKEQAAYLYMFRYLIRISFNYEAQLNYQKRIEEYRLAIGNIQQDMKEKILLHGKDQVRFLLQANRRNIKDYREAIANLEVLGPLFAAAKKGDAEAARRLFTDEAIAQGNPFRINRRHNDHISKLKVCDPRGLRAPKTNGCSPSVILDKKTGART